MPENIPEQEQSAEEKTTALSSVNVPEAIPLTKSQKLAVAVLAFFTLFVLVYWAYSVKRTIMAPFELTDEDRRILAQNAQTATTTIDTGGRDESLKKLDTDGDGLSDYDELYIHKTSPYLADSDSDGFSDFDEIRSGNDPNCPSGRICAPVSAPDSLQGSAADPGAVSNAIPGFNVNNVELPDSPERRALEEILSGNSDAAALRQLLVQAGMDQNLLNQISDEDLMNSYSEVLKGQ